MNSIALLLLIWIFQDIKQSSEGHVLGLWEGYRIRGVYGMKDSVTVLASDTHHR